MRKASPVLFLFVLFASVSFAFCHGVTGGDKGFIEEISGPHIPAFIYLGAKHMVTGYDHLLFLFGVIFFLHRLRDVGIYVTLFALGHSATLILGVYANINANAFLIDAIIGLSVVYKALDNMDAYKKWFGIQPNTKAATFIFGLFHGFGLATKLQEFKLSGDGLFANLLSFNVGVELGQVLALGTILIAIGFWRNTGSFQRQAFSANVVLMILGFLLTAYQLFGYFLAGTHG